MNLEIFVNSFSIPFIWKKEIQSLPIENIFEKYCVSIKVDERTLKNSNEVESSHIVAPILKLKEHV